MGTPGVGDGDTGTRAPLPFGGVGALKLAGVGVRGDTEIGVAA